MMEHSLVMIAGKRRHRDLYLASKKMGGTNALARHLGVDKSFLVNCVNLVSCPPEGFGGTSGDWTDLRLADLEMKLEALTGKTLEELWPEDLRVNHLDMAKMAQRRNGFKQKALQQYASFTRERLIQQSDPSNHLLDGPRADIAEIVEQQFNLLHSREVEVLKSRYGVGTDQKSLREVSLDLKISRERVRQIEGKALKKLESFQKTTSVEEWLEEGSIPAHKEEVRVLEKKSKRKVRQEEKKAAALMKELQNKLAYRKKKREVRKAFLNKRRKDLEELRLSRQQRFEDHRKGIADRKEKVSKPPEVSNPLEILEEPTTPKVRTPGRIRSIRRKLISEEKQKNSNRKEALARKLLKEQQRRIENFRKKVEDQKKKWLPSQG